MSKLIDYCLNITDGEHGTVIDDPNGDYYLLSNKNIIDGKIVITDTDRKINKETFDKLNKRTNLHKGCVLIATVGTIGKSMVLTDEPNYTVQRSVGIITPNPDVLDADFLKFYLDSPIMQVRIVHASKGAIQKCLFIDDIKELEVDIPDMPIQKEIVAKLKPINDKITLNNSICTDLEAMAKQIYDYWFVQFDFPDEYGKPYKSSGGKMVWNEELNREIPEGWEVDNIGNHIIEHDKSKIQVNAVTNNGIYPFFTSGENILKTDNYLVDSFCCYLSTGGFANIKSYYGKASYSTDTWCIEGSDNYEFILPCVLINLLPFMDRLYFAGTGLKHLQKDDFKQYKVCIPESTVYQKYKNQVEPIFKMITDKKIENQQLTELRDFLLPMLMNGQIKIGA